MISTQFQRLAAGIGIPSHALLIAPWLWGLLLTLAMFACVTLHELGHVFVAQAAGAKVRSVTLMMLGGVSAIDDVERPRRELAMAIAGPIVSLVIAGILYLVFRVSGGWPPDVRFGLYYLAEINLVIGVFNLLPAFPMDGGRVLRSALAGRLGRLRATRVAAGVGKGFAIALGLYGLLTGGWWLILIAAFVFLGGDAESRALFTRHALRGLTVGDLFVRRLVTVPSGATAADAATAMLRARRSACLVTADDALLGIVTAEDLAAIPVRARGGLAASALMHAPVVLAASDAALAALRVLDEQHLGAAAVREDDRLAGTLERDDIARGLTLHERIGAPT